MNGLSRPGARRVAAVSLAVWSLVVLLGVLAATLARTQAHVRGDLRARLVLRGEIAAGFIAPVARIEDIAIGSPRAREWSRLLAGLEPVTEQRAYLLSSGGRILAASRMSAVGSPLGLVEPALPVTPDRGTETYREGGRTWVATSTAVPGTPLRIVLSVPADRLYAPVRETLGPSWTVFGAFTLAALLALGLLVRLLGHRRELAQALRVDPLTGVHNRRHLQERLPAMASAAARQGTPWAVLLLDVDHFKQINDERGHAGGDEVLQIVARVVAAEARTEDVSGRWGGDEFVVGLPATDEEGAMSVAARILERLRSRGVGASIGCACAVDASPEELLGRADEALLRAKREGRGQVVPAPPLSLPAR